MSGVVDRYNQGATDYERYWAPVLEEASTRLLEYVEWYAGGPPPDGLSVLDVGTGTGTLARAALERWPTARVIASDAAGGMLDLAQRRIHGFGERLAMVTGSADRLPLDDAGVDVIVSSFVLQLVPDRRAALVEALRLLRPGGLLAYVTWLDRELREPFRPSDEFDAAVLAMGIDEPSFPPERCAGDVPSAQAAAAQLRRAGFRAVVAREDELDYHWTSESYLEYKLAYDERALLSSLDEDHRERLERSARERVTRLPDEAFFWHPPIVYAAARKPG